jgi:hypothetical protein
MTIIVLALAAAAPAPAPASQPAAPAVQTAAPPNTSMTCRFESGPLAGQMRDFSGVPGAKPFAAGAPCTDGKDSIGVAVDDKTTPAPSANRAGAEASAAASASFQCRFTAGPRAGRTAELPNVPTSPRPRGSPCSDGRGSRGMVVR